MTNKSIEITPGMGVYKVFKHLKYKPWFALAEFIDNAQLENPFLKDNNQSIIKKVVEEQN